jgi:threonine dehydrogenase-like Zn-dependent dehydrogenase
MIPTPTFFWFVRWMRYMLAQRGCRRDPSFVLKDTIGEMYFCNLRCFCVWSVQLDETHDIITAQRFDASYRQAAGEIGMQGKRIVIIGGSSAIGLATAKLVSAHGAEVVLVGRNKEKLELARRAVGGDVRIEAADACDRAALDEVFARNAPIDHLVIAATGGRVLGDFQSLDEDILRGAFDSKFWAHWNTAQVALPALTVDGTLVFVTAASSRLANPGTSGLTAVNGAIEKMVPTWRVSWRPGA